MSTGLSRPPLLSVAEALAFLLAAAEAHAGARIESDNVATLEANGRVLARAQVSQLDVPPRDNTQMDGYAVRAADCVSGVARLRVSQRIPAGHVGSALLPGSAARIFTGAMIPDGADAVVMQEVCDAEQDADGDWVTVRHTPVPGEWIRRAGEDIRCGAQILAAGTRLRPQELGLAASVGLAQLPLMPRLRVAVFFTGDELAMPGEVLKPGAIYNSNRFLLRALLENLGCVISDFGIVPDNLAATRETLRRAAIDNDLIITSGGVSVGEEDHIRPAVEAEGRLNLWQIAVKPGKPLAFGTVRRASATTGSGSGSDGSAGAAAAAALDQAFFLGLPGNPVSSFVTFLLFVRPFILRLQGVAEVAPQRFAMRADFAWPRADRRNEFLRVRINASGGLDLFANQSSGVLSSTVWGDGLIDNPAGQGIAVGDTVQFLPFAALLS